METDHSEEIVINGIKYNCIYPGNYKFNIICSFIEAKTIMDIYDSREQVPVYFRGMHTCRVIMEAEEQISVASETINMIIKTA